MLRWMAQGLTCLTACACASAQAAPITLDFEGIAPHHWANNLLPIGDFYHGGTTAGGVRGPDLGVSLVGDARLLCLNTIDYDCSGTSKAGLGPANSHLGALYYVRDNPVASVEAGFDDQFSLWFSNPHGDNIGIEIYASINAIGTPLARALLPSTGTGSPACADYGSGKLAAVYCPFVPFSLDFDGHAHSVKFVGTFNRTAIDDITFGDPAAGPDGPALPEPGAGLLSLLALAALSVTRRRQQPGASGSARSSRSM